MLFNIQLSVFYLVLPHDQYIVNNT